MSNLPTGTSIAAIEQANGTDRFNIFEGWLDQAREHYNATYPDAGWFEDDRLDDGNDTAWESFTSGTGPDDYADQVHEYRTAE